MFYPSFDLLYFTFEVPNEKLLQRYFDRLNEGGIMIAPIHLDEQNFTALRVYKKANGLKKTDLYLVGFQKALLTQDGLQ